MSLHQVQLDGESARATVLGVWPDATSTYVGTTKAQVYDTASGVILGEAESSEFAVEHAWLAAARSTQGQT